MIAAAIFAFATLYILNTEAKRNNFDIAFDGIMCVGFATIAILCAFGVIHSL